MGEALHPRFVGTESQVPGTATPGEVGRSSGGGPGIYVSHNSFSTENLCTEKCKEDASLKMRKGVCMLQNTC